MESITSKRIMRIFTVLLIVLLLVLVLIMLFDSATEWIGNLLGIQNDKAKTVQFIGWAMGEVSIAIGLVLLVWRTEFRAEYSEFVRQKYMRKIIDFMKKITGKRIIFGSTVLFVVLFAGLMSAIFFNSAAEWVGSLFDIESNKTETIQFIGLIMSGALAVIGFVILSRWCVEFLVDLMKKIVDFMGKIINRITSKQIVVGCIFLLVVLFVVLTLVAFFYSVERWVGNLLFSSQMKRDIIVFVGWAMSGTSFVIGLVAFNRRAEAQVENNTLVESGHRQDRFKAATEHLESQKSSSRITAFYEFLHLANDNQEEYQKSILEILYAYIRTTTTASEYGNKTSESSELKTVSDESKAVVSGISDELKSPEEIQILLDGLFKSEETWRDEINPNLQGACLSRVNLFKANLSEANLSEANLSEANLSGANLSGANLSGADLSKARLRKANLFKARLRNANLSEANLWDANLLEAKLLGANLSRAGLSRADLSKANLFKVNLSKAILRGANLFKVTLRSAILSGADLSEADLSEASLFGANLSEANLSEANLLGADLYGADLSGANLSGARLSGARLSGANLSEANLSEANLSEANLSEEGLFGANLSGADLSGADLSGADLSGVDLSNANLSKVYLGGAFCTNKTQFPERFELPVILPDNSDKVQFPEGFVSPEEVTDSHE